MSDTETDGTRSPDNLNFAADFDVLSPASDLGTGVAEQPLQSPPIFPDDFDFDRVPEPSFDGFDWTEIESVAMQQQQQSSQQQSELDRARMTWGNGAEPRFFGVDPEPVFDWAEVEADAAMHVSPTCIFTLTSCVSSLAFSQSNVMVLKREESQKNHRSAICEANTYIRAMCWKKGEVKDTTDKLPKGFPSTICP